MDSPITAAAKQLQKAWEQTINAVAAGRAAKGVVEASCRIEFCPNDHIYLSEWDVEPDISKLFESDEQESLTRMISTALRHGADIEFIVTQLTKAEGNITSFAKAIARTLKSYITEIKTMKCSDCL